MGPMYRLILPEHPPMRDCWVEEDQIVREHEIPYPKLNLKTFAIMVGLTNSELDNLTYHDLKKIPGFSRGQGRTRYIDLHQAEVLLVWLFKHKTWFRFDRLYLGLIQVRTMAYLYGYIDRDGLKKYPTLEDMRKYDRIVPRSAMSYKESKRIARNRRMNRKAR